MTSQVSVMNLRGIAVASDTVLSTSSDAGTKTMGNTGKIYEIAPGHNVLVLHSGNVDLNGIPASLFITEWGRSLSGPLPTLQDYVESFVKWAGREGSLHNLESENIVMSSLLSEHFSWISDLATSQISFLEPKGEKESEAKFQKRIRDAVDSQIDHGLEFLENLPKLPGMSEAIASKALETSSYDLDNWIKSFFGGNMPSDEGNAKLRRSALLALSRYQEMENDLLLAFVGYGSEEPFGSNIRVNSRGIYAGKLQANIEDKFGVSSSGSKSAISHFAQGGAIQAFLRGINWRVYDKLVQSVREAVFNLTDPEGAKVDGIMISKHVTDEIDKYSREEFVDPLMNTVEAMSLKGLGDFAGALVGLQATSTFGEKGPATVGGLVEVVTIDRANGIQWLKKLDTESFWPN